MIRSARFPRWLLLGLVSSLSVVVLASAALAWVSRSAGSGPPRYGRMPAFQLTDQKGHPFSSADLKGKFVAIDFIYTSCPDVCPMVTSKMAGLQGDLRTAGLLGNDVRLLSITVDPQRDTPDVLARYAADHGADTAAWSFLTGDVNQIQSVVSDGFKVGYDLVSPTSDQAGHEGHDMQNMAADAYDVGHTERVILVDPSGEIRAYYDGETLDAAAVIADIQKLR